MHILSEEPPGGNSRLRMAQQMLRLFRGRADHVAVAQGKGFAPEALESPLSPERLAGEHLAGTRCLGFYVMIPGDKVCCACADFDNKPERPDPLWRDKAEKVYRLLAKHGINALVEISQSGSAAHVWIFFKKPLPAWLVRAFWRGVLTHLGIAAPEIYPRQDHLTGKGLGNLVRYPLWSASHFVDVSADWNRLSPLKALSAVSPVSGKRLQRVAAKIGIELASSPKPQSPTKRDTATGRELPARVQQLLAADERLAARWRGETNGLYDTSRSAVVQSIACLLVFRFVPTAEIEAAIRYWCHKEGYGKGYREDWIEGVIAKAYDLAGERLQHGRQHDHRLPKDTPDLIRKSFAHAVARKTRRKP